MRSDLWSEIVGKFDKKMKQQGRQVVLLVDNAPCHSLEASVSLTNTQVKFLPPNTTALIQPLDQGIIAAFKARYKALLAREQLAALESGMSLRQFHKGLSVRDALGMAQRAWDEVPPTAIKNCFSKAWRLLGLPQTEEAAVVESEAVGESAPERFEDDELACYGELTAQEIATEVLHWGSDDDNESEAVEEVVVEQAPTPTTAQVLQMLNSIKCYLDKKKMDTSLVWQLREKVMSEYDDSQVQTALERYHEKST